MPIHCDIVSQDRMVFEGDVDIVVLPGTDGEMGVLPHHAPLLTTLKFGLIKVRRQGQEEVFTVAGGVAARNWNVRASRSSAAKWSSWPRSAGASATARSARSSSNSLYSGSGRRPIGR